MYTLDPINNVLRKNEVVIQNDDSTPEYKDFLEWVRRGNSPAQVDPLEPAYPRIEVSAWQIRKALNKEGLRQAVEAWVAASESQELKDGYNHAPTFWSDHEFAHAAGAALGKDAEWMYNFFLLAKSL